MSDRTPPTDVLEFENDLEPDPEPEEVPSAIIQEDEAVAPQGMTAQALGFGVAIILIIFLVLLLASGNNINLFNLFGGNNNAQPTLQPLLNSVQLQSNRSLDNEAAALEGQRFYGVDGLNSLPSYAAEIDPLFLPYWVKNGGEPIFGRPISGLLEENGRQFQWFERTRLEWWPEHQGTKYEVQPGRVGVEFTKNRDFPNQQFFANRPGLRYSEATQQGLRGLFLEFWEANGGIDLLGWPISEELQEVLPEDRTVHTVQYFERGRLELHPNDPNQTVKIGLLGRALYFQDSEPNYIEPVAPTAVPVIPLR
ncbi:hypothetical protein ACP8Y2_20245 [Herpetosiphon llansteffanensis]